MMSFLNHLKNNGGFDIHEFLMDQGFTFTSPCYYHYKRELMSGYLLLEMDDKYMTCTLNNSNDENVNWVKIFYKPKNFIERYGDLMVYVSSFLSEFEEVSKF
jgi:hypothetical protein